jgi:thiosulfate/3-mercaptopyruvate sulfurtransferase
MKGNATEFGPLFNHWNGPMKSWILFVAAWVVTLSSLAATPLVNPSTLEDLLANPQVRVVDIREPQYYRSNHVPGSVNAPYDVWRGPASNPGELPALPKLTSLVQSLGITPQSHVIVLSTGLDETDFGATARVYWTLKVLGVQELSILNGGFKAWIAEGGPLSTTPPKVAPSRFAPQIDPSMIATRAELVERVQSGQSVLLDARPSAFFKGETRHASAKLPGTLKGAVNLEHNSWFQPKTGIFVGTPQAQQVATKAAINPAKATVSFCNTGHWAATNWFALSEVLGQKNVKLYAGSMVDWTQASAALPMDNVPSRGKQLMIDAKLWADRVTK